MEIPYSDFQAMQQQLKKLMRCCKGSSTPITYAKAQQLINDGALQTGGQYLITDRGDGGLLMVASSPEGFHSMGYRKMLVPWTYDVGRPMAPYRWMGPWHTDMENMTALSIEIDDLVIRGGYVWRNLNGNLGAANGQFGLDAEWIPLVKVEGLFYEYKWFGILYDFDNDWISKQWDENNNIFGIAYDNLYNRSLPAFDPPTFNPVDVCDWNWAANSAMIHVPIFQNNHCIGIWHSMALGNLDDGRNISDNHMPYGTIEDSYVINWIIGNRNPEGIVNCYGNGLNNIRFNANNGKIFDVTCVSPNSCNVEYCVNNGDVTGVKVADVSSPIVDL